MRLDEVAHEIAALVRRAAVPDGVAEADVTIDLLFLVGLHDAGERLEVCVRVREDADPHPTVRLPWLAGDQILFVEEFFVIVVRVEIRLQRVAVEEDRVAGDLAGTLGAGAIAVHGVLEEAPGGTRG